MKGTSYLSHPPDVLQKLQKMTFSDMKFHQCLKAQLNLIFLQRYPSPENFSSDFSKLEEIAALFDPSAETLTKISYKVPKFAESGIFTAGVAYGTKSVAQYQTLGATIRSTIFKPLFDQLTHCSVYFNFAKYNLVSGFLFI